MTERAPRPDAKTETAKRTQVNLDLAIKETQGKYEAIKEFVKEKSSAAFEKMRHTRLGDAAARLERVGIRWFNRPLVAWNEHFYQRCNEKTIKAEIKVASYDKRIADYENQLKSTEQGAERLRARGHLDSRTAIKVEREKAAFVKKIEGLKKDQENANVRLEFYNNKKATWENKQKMLAERIGSQVERKAGPHLERFESLKERRDEIASDFRKFENTKKQWVENLESLQKELKTSPKSIRTVFKRQIKAIKTALADVEKKTLALKKEQIKIERKMSVSQTRVNKWKVVSNEFNRIANRERRYVEVETPENIQPESRRAYTFDETPNEPKAERYEARADMTPDDYLDKWNDLFPEQKINKEFFMVETGLVEGQPASAELFYPIIRDYLEHNRFGDLSKKEIKENLKKLREALDK